MSAPRPIIVTGASGFLGTRLLRQIRSDRPVVAIDRRLPDDPSDLNHEGVRWVQIDLADSQAVRDAFREITDAGGADHLVHLAAYYDFTGDEHPEYRRTNVDALRFVLEESRTLGLKRFFFASSTAACPFPAAGEAIREDTPPDGDNVYAVSKRAGELLLAEYADEFPSCIVRYAAMFSDWCEYPPLYFFLGTWLSDRWNARILGGRGNSAIPFLHVRDAAAFMQRLLDRADVLGPGEVVQCSPNGCTTHNELFSVATAYHFGKERKPLHMPKPLAAVGIRVRETAGRILGQVPFERAWMARYIDLEMNIDARRTHERLAWAPQPRLEILRRIPFMIENMKTDPVAWYQRNQEVLDHLRNVTQFEVARLVERHRESIEAAYAAIFEGETGRARFPGYARLASGDKDWRSGMVVRTLIVSLRAGRKGIFMQYCRDAALMRKRQGIPAEQMLDALRAFGRICLDHVRRDPEAAGLERAIRDHLEMAIEFSVDQVLDAYEAAGEP
jgi:nucleoside-diphosphate-sugar epimerase